MVTDLWFISLITREEHGIHKYAMLLSNYKLDVNDTLTIWKKHRIQCTPCSSQIISEMLPEIHTMEKCYFLKAIIHFQIIRFSVANQYIL